MKPSIRLRLLTFMMRYIVKPTLRRTGTPEAAHRLFEFGAPFLFSKPKDMRTVEDGSFLRVSVADAVPNRAILYLHGGGFFTGSWRSYYAFAGHLAQRSKAVVFLADYPLLQVAPFPAAPDAALAAWDRMIGGGWRPDQIVIAGDSAGGNLVFGLLAQLLARGQRPAGIVGFSPWGDLTLSGDTIVTNADLDPIIPVNRMQEVVDFYLVEADSHDPRASPVFAQFPDPPPVLIQVGATEVLRSDCERLATLTGALLDVWPNVPHVWQLFDGRLPEANAAMRKAAQFIHTSFESASR